MDFKEVDRIKDEIKSKIGTDDKGRLKLLETLGDMSLDSYVWTIARRVLGKEKGTLTDEEEEAICELLYEYAL